MKVKIMKDAEGTSYWLWCPGCDDAHRINDGWQFDGNIEAPTFSPSILVNYGNNPDGHKTCHSFLRAGVWEFLGDSTHAFAGQNIPMVDLPEWLANEV